MPATEARIGCGPQADSAKGPPDQGRGAHVASVRMGCVRHGPRTRARAAHARAPQSTAHAAVPPRAGGRCAIPQRAAPLTRHRQIATAAGAAAAHHAQSAMTQAWRVALAWLTLRRSPEGARASIGSCSAHDRPGRALSMRSPLTSMSRTATKRPASAERRSCARLRIEFSTTHILGFESSLPSCRSR